MTTFFILQYGYKIYEPNKYSYRIPQKPYVFAACNMFLQISFNLRTINVS
jgi:hypothetical protein